MSKYLKLAALNISDPFLLVETLQGDTAFGGDNPVFVECHSEAVGLYGAEGRLRPETAEIIVRRRFLGRSSNDIGFKLQEDGNYLPIISEFDSGYYNSVWLGKLSQNYSVRQHIATMEHAGCMLESRQVNAAGEVEIEFRQIEGW